MLKNKYRGFTPHLVIPRLAGIWKGAGFTLMEILVIIVIIGSVVAASLPVFTKSKERALGKEANATLKLIATAEKNFRMETGAFYTGTDITLINQNLSLSIVETSWDYNISGSSTVFTATANRTGTDPNYRCQYSLAYDAASASNPENPSVNSTAACP